MLFCPECGSILKPIKKGTKVINSCSCGYTGKDTGTKLRESVHTRAADVSVVDKEVETNPETNETCEKCSNTKATYWFVQTRAGDEAATKFLRCTKCKHTWREY